MNRTALIALGLAGAGAALYLAGYFDDFELLALDGGEEVPQGPDFIDQSLLVFDPSSWDFTNYFAGGTTVADTDNSNVRAFLKAIRYAEGTAGPNGYKQIFATRGGPNTFSDFSDHPRVAKQFTSQGKTLWTSAAGAYQFMAASRRPDGTWTKVDTWTGLKNKLGLPDFSPASQDLAAIELVRQCGALGDVKAGRFDAAVAKCKGTWASLPGATYGQPTKDLTDLRNVFAAAGGYIASA